jgi:hypothetical protein
MCCPLATFAQADFASIDLFLKSTLKAGDQLSVQAKGDLNGDRLEDWAGVIQRGETGASPTYQLYVLLRAGQGGYRVAGTSKEAPIPGMGCCWVENLEIKRSSIYVQNNAKTASTMEAATHQFKLYNGEWRLVGVRIYDIDQSSDTSIETDMNLLAGAVIEKKQKGERRPTTTSRRKRFSASLLRDYDFNNGFGIE